MSNHPARIIVLIAGRAGTGKDTAADYLVQRYDFIKLAFAQPLKRACIAAFGVSATAFYDRDAKETPMPEWPGITPREALQLVGTNFFRDQVFLDFWVRRAAITVNRQPEVCRWVFPDCRFGNETQLARYMESPATVHTVRLERDAAGATGGIPGHISEADAFPVNHTIQNNGDVEQLHTHLDRIMPTLLETGGTHVQIS